MSRSITMQIFAENFVIFWSGNKMVHTLKVEHIIRYLYEYNKLEDYFAMTKEKVLMPPLPRLAHEQRNSHCRC